MSKEKTVLRDHKRVGKRFVPPILQTVAMKDAPWLARTLPELIWLGVLVDTYGGEEGIALGRDVAHAAWNFEGESTQTNFAFASAYTSLTLEQKELIVEALGASGVLPKIEEALQPFFALYPDCPLSFLGKGDHTPGEPGWVKDLVEQLADRNDQPAMLVQACVPYFLGLEGKLYFVKGVDVPDLEAIAKDFDSEVARRSTGQVRAFVNGCMGFLAENLSDDWPRYFWNRGLALEPVSAASCVDSAAIEDETCLASGLPPEICTYLKLVREGFDERWQKLPKDAFESEITEAIGALLARQVSVARRIARNPGVWDWHIGPILLRTLVDTHITLAWILADPLSRARKFVSFGLGQEKLQIEHLKAVNAENNDTDIASLIEVRQEWVTAQRYMFLLEVDVGAWSGMSTRDMAEEVGLQSLYNFAYAPWSSCTHSMWNHVGKFNLRFDGSPLHRYLKAPFDPEFEPQMDVLYNSAKYLGLSFDAIDQHFGLKCETMGPYAYWL